MAIVERKDQYDVCRVCKGKKKIKVITEQDCPACDGSGKYNTYHYIISDGKNAVESDNLA